MNKILSPEQLREALHKLFKDAGYTNPELLENIELLAAENDRLKQEVKNGGSLLHVGQLQALP